MFLFFRKLKHDWWLETNNVLLGNSFRTGEYLSVSGFCSIYSAAQTGESAKLEFKGGHLWSGNLFLIAQDIKFVNEKVYNLQFSKIIKTDFKNRYSKKTK